MGQTNPLMKRCSNLFLILLELAVVHLHCLGGRRGVPIYISKLINMNVATMIYDLFYFILVSIYSRGNIIRLESEAITV